MSYIQELRALAGPRPLLYVGAGVVAVNEAGELLMFRRTDSSAPGGERAEARLACGTVASVNRSALLLSLLLCCTLACSRKVESSTLGLQYEPPSGMALRNEEPGPPAVAHFEGGLEVRSVQGTPPKVDAAPEDVLGAAGIPVPGRRVNATTGTLPAGPVGRYEFQQGSSRTLVYFLPLTDRFVLVLYTAPERDYGPGSSRVERSLSTLKPTR